MIFMLTQTPLFQGIPTEDLSFILNCLEHYQRDYEKDAYIYHAGDTITHAGLILSGSVIIEHNDIWGNKSILRRGHQGELFGESYIGNPLQPLSASIIAATPTRVLFLNISKILNPSIQGCQNHSRLIRNVLQIMTRRNSELSQKILHTTSKSIRGRLLSYFSEQIAQQGSNEIFLSFNRQQLADYLSVDRSSMSAELSKMAKDGLLSYHKNHIILHSPSL